MGLIAVIPVVIAAHPSSPARNAKELAALTHARAGFVPLVTDNITSLKPHIDSGRLRGIAIGSAQRAEAAPQLATLAESGYPGF